MKQFLRRLRSGRFSNTPLITIALYQEHILHNLHSFQHAYPQLEIAPVLKSNAYGHGLVEVAMMLKNEKVPFLCVDSYFEARVVRGAGVRIPLLIIGYTPFPLIQRDRLADVSFSITSLAQLEELSHALKRKTRIHLKFDTGMHRQGLLPKELKAATTLVEANKKITVEGVFSHLADADTPDSPVTIRQIETWNTVATGVRWQIPHVRYFHLAATEGGAYLNQVEGNMMRLGIGLYGISSSDRPNDLDLRPALEIRARITSLRTIAAGETVGYGATFTASQEMKIATVPVGYYEGLDRRLSNKGVVTINGTPCPIIGRVSMNMCSVDVSGIANVQLDDEVLVISAVPNAPNSLRDMAKLCDTIPYEIMVHVPAHLKRTVV